MTAAVVHAAAPDRTSECDEQGLITDSFEEITCGACLKIIGPWVDGTAEGAPLPAPAVAPIRIDPDGAMHLTERQAHFLIETMCWNVDEDTVRLDNSDPERADFIAAVKALAHD